MAKGFAAKIHQYKLHIFHSDTSWEIPIEIPWQGKLSDTDQKALDTATCAWAVCVYGQECDAYQLICEALGEEVVEAISQLHEQLKGQQFTGKLRDSKKYMLSKYATNLWMEGNLKEYQPINHARRIAC